MHAIGECFEDELVVIFTASCGVSSFLVANLDSQRKGFTSLAHRRQNLAEAALSFLASMFQNNSCIMYLLHDSDTIPRQGLNTTKANHIKVHQS